MDCKKCQKEFPQRYENQKYCSRKCLYERGSSKSFTKEELKESWKKYYNTRKMKLFKRIINGEKNLDKGI